ncbi:MAG TPA: OB-fold domain-containing protein [Methylomirabilota bacterium]|nr:OB-fold domain-containing protein [Methylomirabilota bacterium]
MRVEYRGMALIVPETDGEWHGYYAAAREHRLVVQRCERCGLLRYPPGAGCPWCGAPGWRWEPVSGRGTIHSYEIVVHAIQPGFRDWAPYPVVVVELDEQRGIPTADDGLRLVANLLTPDLTPEAEALVAIGARVEVCFQPVTPDLVLPQFKLSGEAPAGRPWRFPG